MTEKIRGMEELVSITKLKPNEWNPNEQSEFIFLREKRSIEKYGFVMPVLVRELPEGGYEIIDGEHRWRAVREIHAEGIPIYTTPKKDSVIPKGKINIKNLGEVSDPDAKQMTILMNKLRGESDTLKEADLLKNLAETENFQALADLLPFQEDELGNMIKMADFDWDEFKEGSETRPDDDEKWVTVKFRLSQDQANVVNEAIERLVRQVPIEGENVDGRALEMMAADSIGTPIESYQ